MNGRRLKLFAEGVDEVPNDQGGEDRNEVRLTDHDQ